MTTIFQELKRRNVFKVGLAYLVVSWIVMQMVNVLEPALNLPNWVDGMILTILIALMPIACLFAWAFELTPEGFKKTTEVEAEDSIRPETGKKLNRIIMGMLVVALAYFIYESRFQRSTDLIDNKEATEQSPPTTTYKASIAVLPFVNMSSDAEQEFFSDGLTEELLNVLVRVKGLKVASRTSSFAFKGTKPNLADVAATLKVDHILEGSVRKAGNSIRITAQLIDAKTDTHLWSETYDRQLDDIFAIQDEISGAIVTALQGNLGIEAVAPSVGIDTKNMEAYQLFLKARQLLIQRGLENLIEAQNLLIKTIDLDPNYTRAISNYAYIIQVRPIYDQLPPNYGLIFHLVDKALKLNPNDPTALMVKGILSQQIYNQPLEAMALYEKAMALAPQDPNIHIYSGLFYSSLGYQKKALSFFQKAYELEPNDYTAFQYALGLYSMGNIEQAKSYHKASRALPFTYFYWGLVYLQEGDEEKAKEFLKIHANLVKKTPILSELTPLLVRQFKGEKEALRQLEQIVGQSGEPLNWFSSLLLHKPKQAIDMMKRMEIRKDIIMLTIKIPYFLPLWNDPDMQAYFEWAGYYDAWEKLGPPDHCTFENRVLVCAE